MESIMPIKVKTTYECDLTGESKSSDEMPKGWAEVDVNISAFPGFPAFHKKLLLSPKGQEKLVKALTDTE